MEGKGRGGAVSPSPFLEENLQVPFVEVIACCCAGFVRVTMQLCARPSSNPVLTVSTPQMLNYLAGRDPTMLHTLGITPEVSCDAMV